MACGKTLSPGDAKRMEKSLADLQHPDLSDRAIRDELKRMGVDKFLEQAARDSAQLVKRLAPRPLSGVETAANRRVGAELGLSRARSNSLPKVSRAPSERALKDCVQFLADKRIPRVFVGAVRQVQFVPHYLLDRDGERIKGITKGRTIYIPEGPGREVPSAHDLRVILSHEIVHVNWKRISQKIDSHKESFTAAVASQLASTGAPTEYFDTYDLTKLSRGDTRDYFEDKRERAAELYRCYLVEPERLDQTMVAFFDKHFSPGAWGEAG